MTPVQPKSPFFLAPMEAVNCASFRLLCKRRGAALVYTDMIDADKFKEYADAHGGADTPQGAQAAIDHYINPQDGRANGTDTTKNEYLNEYPLVIQLGGANIPNLLYTIKHVEPIATIIDLNIGCPLPYMLAKKGGVYLSKHPDQLKKVISAMRAAITKIPFTVKIRAGWDEDSINAVEVAQLLESLGVDAVGIHARTRAQGYRDRADWQLARKIKEAIKIPLILSGDVTNVYMAYMGFAHTKCDYIMVARGAQNNPSVFTHLNEWYKTADKKDIPLQPQTTYDKNAADALADFSEFLKLYKTQEKRYRLSELKDHALWTARECQHAANVKQAIINAKDAMELLAIISELEF